MKKLDNLGTRLADNGIKISWGLFLCPACGIEVERQLSNGHRNKTCGCQRHVRDMAVPKEEKQDRLKHQEARQYATLHCKHHSGCLNKTYKTNKLLPCYQCDLFEEVKNCYQDEIIPNECYGFDEMTEHKVWV